MARLTFLLVLLAACDLGTGPSFPGEPITPDPSWRADWAAMETCSGRRGDFDRVRWYMSPNGSLGFQGDRPYVGMWSPPHRVYLTPSAGDNTRRHEMLHDIEATGEHPPTFTACRV